MLGLPLHLVLGIFCIYFLYTFLLDLGGLFLFLSYFHALTSPHRHLRSKDYIFIICTRCTAYVLILGLPSLFTIRGYRALYLIFGLPLLAIQRLPDLADNLFYHTSFYYFFSTIILFIFAIFLSFPGFLQFWFQNFC